MEVCNHCNGERKSIRLFDPKTRKVFYSLVDANNHFYPTSNKLALDRFKDKGVNLSTFWNMASVFLELNKEDTFRQRRELENKNYYSLEESICNCPFCSKDRDKLEYYYINSREDKIINGSFFETIIESGILSKQIVNHFLKIKLENQIPKPVILAGDSRAGKSLLLKYLYNKTLKLGNDPKLVHYIKEMKMFESFIDEREYKSFMAQLKGIKYLFVDEFMAVENWKDVYADREKATSRHKNAFLFWDTISESGVNIYLATNLSFNLYTKEESTQRLVNRVREKAEVIEVRLNND